MTRKIRHPYQVLEASEMVVGKRYAFIQARADKHFVDHYVLGAVIDDSHAMALRLGYDLDSAGEPRVEMFVVQATKPAVTVHIDGWWYGSDTLDVPTVIYWKNHSGLYLGWDRLETYLGPKEKHCGGEHTFVVPSQHWEDDPRVHIASWNNPNGVIERATLAESAAEWEHRMRAKIHVAMAKMLGF